MPRPALQRIPGSGPGQQRFVLTPQQLRWVEEYLLTHDPRDAATRVGLPPEAGPRLLAQPAVQSAISFASRRALTRQQVYLEDVLRNLVALRDADPNELVSIRRAACRHCWGVDNERQFTDLEYRHALSAHRQAMALLNPDDPNIVPFDEKGGPGYTVNRDPARGLDWVERHRTGAQTAPDSCPACYGDGDLRVLVRDTTNLSPGARLLYDGVKVTPGGVEVKLRDRAWAEDRLARYAGAFNDRRTPTDPNRLSDDQLVDAVVTLVERGTLSIEHLPNDVTDVDPS